MMVLGQTAEETLLGRSPSVSPSGVCFACGGDIWTADKTVFGLNASWLDMSNFPPRVKSSLSAAVLQKGEPSPFAPENDEENPESPF